VSNHFDPKGSLWNHKAGDKVVAKVVREGKEMQVTLTLSSGTSSASADATPRTGSAVTEAPVVQH
jgi:S1-C subfamily serine protease